MRSSLPLPELFPWLGDDRSPDVEISFDTIQEPIEPPIFVRTFSKLWADGTYILKLDNVGQFFVSGGDRVLVNPMPNALESELRLFILGTCLGMLCHQRGLFPLHASSVNIDGKAVLFAGDSGAGKSTIAAALGARGHALVADDVTVVESSGSFVLPAYAQRKLAPDVLKALAIPQKGLELNRLGTVKFRVPALAGFDPAPLKPAVIYIIEKNQLGQSSTFKRLPPPLILAHLTVNMYRYASGVRIQKARTLFQTTAQLAQTAQVFILLSCKDLPLSDLGKLAESVESHVRSLGKDLK